MHFSPQHRSSAPASSPQQQGTSGLSLIDNRPQTTQRKVKVTAAPLQQKTAPVPVNDDVHLEQEADTMGQQALQHPAPVQRQVHTASASSTAQLMRVTIEKDAKTKLGKGNAQAMQKLRKLTVLIEDAIGDLLKKNTISIEIINNGEMSPAWNHHKGSTWHPGKEGDIGVELNKWYLEKASLGDLLGMFIHEIGVHTLSSLRMGATNAGNNAIPGSEYHQEFTNQSVDHINPQGGRIERFPNTREAANRGRKRQRDHVNLAKSLSGGASTRGRHYIDLYLRTGDAVMKNEKNPKQRSRTLKDLTQYFLFDIARLVATDDGGAAKLFWNSGNIGALMSYYQQQLVTAHGKKHVWLASASSNITTGKWQIRGWLLGQLGKLAVSSNPAVQVGRSALVGVGAAVGGSLLGLAALPALGVGAAVGLGIYGAQKLLGV